MTTPTILRPQDGPQMKFHQSKADVVLYGGAASGGKSWSLCIEALRHINNPACRAVIFRRTSPMLRSAGSIYQLAKEVYIPLGAELNDTRLQFRFPSGGTITFSHMQSNEHAKAWQGSEISYLGYDELTHFTKSQFVYLLSRLRNKSIKPVCRMTCNPDSSSWVKSLVEPYLDSNNQFPNLEMSGKILYIGFDENEEITFSKEKDESHPLSFTFIPASINDNKILQEADPEYINKLKSLSIVEKNQLLYGDWNISYSAGNVFTRSMFIPIDPINIPGDFALGFDLASTAPSAKNRDPDYCAAVLMQKNGFNTYIYKAWKQRIPAGQVYSWMNQVVMEAQVTTRNSMGFLTAYVEVEPGSASNREIINIKKELPTIPVEGVRSLTNKLTRARPLSDAAQKGNVFIFKGMWNEEYLKEMESFPTQGIHDDIVDASTLAFNQLKIFRY